ncbi:MULTISPECIES: DUF3618 domain-containing protein [unclassified Arthrobacter]|uniref:DUF3618 domain-containing protein n=1 Tax=unclassified Arthrobacter TaxID=235627 RepID=UPI001490C93F|nr:MULTISPECIES: DUF3618 domain-containing protein [unclassified Arthrobacter]MBE0009045.1 DUF3618 domain-containing protein [Arthrobacter sp. AET 35A]NOJ60779.1 DUF3618 domain-containing protein [Arthrobacter sp. 260]NOJ62825.1 DUF3618 domain-containing protein [Arthrobacter sp. 147(2020)]
MNQTPEQIRADIERTRRELGTDVDAVADKVSPSSIAQRQGDKVRNAVGGLKTSVMGSADHASAGTRSAAQNASDAVQDAPQRLTRKTQGNPLAAGLIAFGAGMLISSLIPASEKEKEAAAALKEKAEPLTSSVTDAAKAVAEDLKEPAQQAMDSVKETATISANTVKEEGASAAADVKGKAQDAKDNVQNEASRS